MPGDHSGGATKPERVMFQPIVIYCASGHRGGIGLLALRMLGWTEVRDLGGGVSAWSAAELPLVK